MAQYGDQRGRQAEEYGDPVHRPTGVDYGTTGAGGTYGTTGSHQTDPDGTTGTLGPQVISPHVTSATMGAIRPEPYPATGTHPASAQGTTTDSTGAHQTDPDKATGTTGGEHDGHREKKGMMEKIKEKLPGHRHNKTT
ncbi:hypothetical protein F511_24954 [Dorcoceras hygrometricum]|uniref:Uncharacterized protein n=1 Tax=Dorcoceras hygrometricum TaxID=472368 RepID=A0A2Z7DER1_9LAMI|nr:hypothetical protein F511_24954 [Dorcoceras hygrometricum]